MMTSGEAAGTFEITYIILTHILFIVERLQKMIKKLMLIN